jgi:antitoxin YefM
MCRGIWSGLDLLYVFAYNKFMKTASYSELRQNLAAMLDSVEADHEPVIITRDRGKPAAVLMSLEDFASYEETQYLLKSPRNAERLLTAIAELEAGGGTVREID